MHLAALAAAPSDSLRQRHREQSQVQRSGAERGSIGVTRSLIWSVLAVPACVDDPAPVEALVRANYGDQTSGAYTWQAPPLPLHEPQVASRDEDPYEQL